MKPSTIQLWLTFELRDKKGQLLKRICKPSRSFVLAWNQIQQLLLAAGTLLSIVDTGGSARTFTSGAAGGQWLTTFPYNLICGGGVGDATWGIVVGTGTNAPANNDYALQTQIATGNGAGQLAYQGDTYTPAGIVGSNVDLVFTRTFINNSGGTITVKEAGIYAIASDSGGTPRKLCIVHDLQTLAVTNGLTLTVTYTMRTTV